MKKIKLFLAVLLTAQLIAQTALVAASQGEKKQIQIDERERVQLLDAVRFGNEMTVDNWLDKQVWTFNLDTNEIFEKLKMIKDNEGINLFNLAVKKNVAKTVEVLLNNEDAKFNQNQRYALLSIRNKDNFEKGFSKGFSNEEDSWTPLHYAFSNANADMIKVLLKDLTPGQNINLLTMKDIDGNTPLHLAYFKNSYKKDIDWPLFTTVVKEMLANFTAEQKFKLLTNDHTTLHAVWQTDVIEELLNGLNKEQKYDLLTMKNDDGNTPLHQVIIRGGNQKGSRVEAIKALIAGLTPSQKLELLLLKNNNGRSVLDLVNTAGVDDGTLVPLASFYLEIMKSMKKEWLEGSRDRSLMQKIFMEFSKLCNESSNKIDRISINKELSDLFGYIIYDEKKAAHIIKDKKELFDAHCNLKKLEKSLSKDIQDFYMILTEKKYKVDDLDDDKNNAKKKGYYATPRELHLKLEEARRLNKSAFEDAFATRNKVEQFKNLQNAATKPQFQSKFSDIDIILE